MSTNNPFNNPALDENGNFKKVSLQKDEDIYYLANSTQLPTKKEVLPDVIGASSKVSR